MAAKMPIQRVGEIMKAVLTELKIAGGEAKLKDLLERVEPKLNLSDYEKEVYEKSGYVRWHTFVHFYSIDCVKAGYIQKSQGIWHLTPQGEQALNLPALEFMQNAQRKYRAWKSTRDDTVRKEENQVDTNEPTEIVVRQTAYDRALETAQTEIEDHIKNLGWYDFQRLVAELLIAMGYHIPFVAPPGQDGGVDIVAYSDPLGTSTPRIKVQVKHREQKVTVKEIRELEGVLRKEGDIGLMVSSGGFTSQVEQELRSSAKHIETMDLARLIGLWKQHYDQLREPGKALLPLVKLYFLAPTQEI